MSYRTEFCDNCVEKNICMPLLLQKMNENKKKKIYISGAVTGLSEKEVKTNFSAAEQLLKQFNFDVVNPVSHTIKNGTWEEYMKQDIKLLCDCDFIFMIDGWGKSRGACIELNLAIDLKISVLTKEMVLCDKKILED